MFSWSVRRRALYLFLLLVVLSTLALTVFLVLRPPASCFDGLRNQDELGVDCGGVCQAVCPSETSEIKVVWSQVLPLLDGRFDAASLIYNPNQSYGVKRLDYTLKVFDAENLLITTKEGFTFLNPGEKFVVFQPRLAVGLRTPVRAILETQAAPTWQRLDFRPPPLSWEVGSFRNEPFARLEVRIQNTSLRELRDLEVVVVMSDAARNAIAVSSTYLERLAARTAQDLVFTWPISLPEPPVFFDLYPHLDLRQLPA